VTTEVAVRDAKKASQVSGSHLGAAIVIGPIVYGVGGVVTRVLALHLLLLVSGTYIQHSVDKH